MLRTSKPGGCWHQRRPADLLTHHLRFFWRKNAKGGTPHTVFPSRYIGTVTTCFFAAPLGISQGEIPSGLQLRVQFRLTQFGIFDNRKSQPDSLLIHARAGGRWNRRRMQKNRDKGRHEPGRFQCLHNFLPDGTLTEQGIHSMFKTIVSSMSRRCCTPYASV